MLKTLISHPVITRLKSNSPIGKQFLNIRLSHHLTFLAVLLEIVFPWIRMGR